jgi:3-methyladenine DNA glycosylase AlkD
VKAHTQAAMDELRAVADASRLPGMARVGINVTRAIGVSMPDCRRIARAHRGDHGLAIDLWRTRIHEARILASLVDDPALVTAEQMEEWVAGFDSWDVCDQVCGNLFGQTANAFPAARAWVRRDEGFVKRAGFVIVAERAARDRVASDAFWLRWLPTIRRGATDKRNEVMKGVNWALRAIGKRNAQLNDAAIETAERLIATGSRSARWVGRDALRELRSEAVRSRLRARGTASPRA